jgi:hypothetical protein
VHSRAPHLRDSDTRSVSPGRPTTTSGTSGGRGGGGQKKTPRIWKPKKCEKTPFFVFFEVENGGFWPFLGGFWPFFHVFAKNARGISALVFWSRPPKSARQKPANLYSTKCGLFWPFWGGPPKLRHRGGNHHSRVPRESWRTRAGFRTRHEKYKIFFLYNFFLKIKKKIIKNKFFIFFSTKYSILFLNANFFSPLILRSVFRQRKTLSLLMLFFYIYLIFLYYGNVFKVSYFEETHEFRFGALRDALSAKIKFLKSSLCVFIFVFFLRGRRDWKINLLI